MTQPIKSVTIYNINSQVSYLFQVMMEGKRKGSKCRPKRWMYLIIYNNLLQMLNFVP